MYMLTEHSRHYFSPDQLLSTSQFFLFVKLSPMRKKREQEGKEKEEYIYLLEIRKPPSRKLYHITALWINSCTPTRKQKERK